MDGNPFNFTFLNHRLHEQMGHDAAFVAAHIVRDMGVTFGRKGLFWTHYLGARFGDYEIDDLLEENNRRRLGGRKLLGFYDRNDESIVLDWRLFADQHGQVLRHEIAHKLAIGTDRYLELNQPHFVYYDWYTFHELIAQMVGEAYTSKKRRAWLLGYLPKGGRP